MKKVYVGIDLGSKVCVMVAIDARGELIEREEFPTSAKAMVDFMVRQDARVSVLMEEGELAGWAYRALLPHAERVIVSDPKRNAWISKSANKNDLVDAGKLADLNRLGSYAEVHHPEDMDMVAFKVAVQHYEEMTKRTSRLKVQIKARFRTQGVFVEGSRVYSSSGRHDYLSMVSHSAIRDLIAQELDLLDELTKQKSKALYRMINLSRGFPVVDELKRIPGVGARCACRFVAYVSDPARFASRERFISYCRLSVAKRSSNGSPIGRQHLTKNGVGALKDVSRTAFMAAMRSKGDNLFKRYYTESVKRTGNPVHARLNTQRKILLVMLAVWRDGTRFNDNIAGA